LGGGPRISLTGAAKDCTDRCRRKPPKPWQNADADTDSLLECELLKKLLAEKCHLGFASRTRSEQSDEQSAEQLQEADHPEAGIAHRGICASPDTIFGSHRWRGFHKPAPA
jgi:hypothetical protein